MSRTKKQNQKLIFFILIITITVVLSACTKSSHTIINGSIERNGDKVTGSYDKYNGYTEYVIKFDKTQIKLKGNSTDENGTLHTELRDKDGTLLLNWENPKDQEIEIDIVQKEKYYLKITGDEHRGDFSIDWE